jgi:hypothetical protein
MTTLPFTPTETLISFLLWLIAIPVIALFVLRAPKLVALGFITVIFMFSESSWGTLTASNNIYSRGAGMFYFSLLNLTLLIAGAAALVRQLADPYRERLAPPMSKYLVAFVCLLLAHLVVGTLILGKEPEVVLGTHGFVNVINMLVFMYLVIFAFRSEKDAHRLLYLIIIFAMVRGVFGLVRYVWFGGDPTNPYQNFDDINIKLLFFDIGDNFVAALAAFCAAWLVSSPQARLSVFQRLFFWGILFLEIAVVALSFRRSSMLGLGLMFIPLLLQLPTRKKIRYGLLALGLLTIIAVVFFQNRLQYVGHGADKGILSALIFDIAPKRSISDNRFYELYAAAQSVGDNWLFGLGTWGTFTGDQELLAYHMGVFDFIHSGFGHIIMKAGVVGLVMFSLLLLAYTSYYLRHRKVVTGVRRLLADAGFAGLLFWIPTLLIGTPIIEFRTMLLMGLTLALPFVAVRLEYHQPRAVYAAA